MASLLGAAEPVSFAQIRDWFPDDYATTNPTAGARKFERDKADLLELGLPLEHLPADEDGPDRYRVDRRRFALGPLNLTPEEAAVAVAAGSALLAEDEAFPYRDELRVALSKLLIEDVPGATPGSATLPGLAMHPAVGVGPEARHALDTLAAAVRQRKRVTFTYRARYSGEVTRRKVDPYGVYCQRGKWAFVGHSHERGAVRAFLVERTAGLRANPNKPRTPDFEVPAGFDVRETAAIAPWRYEAHDPIDVTLAVDSDYAWLAERHFGVAGRPDGGATRIAIEVTNADAVVEWVLSMAPHVHVAAPAALARRVRSQLSALLARHRA
jgi:proteasome accessory factor B